MKTQISNYPSSYLAVELENGEKIITEKGSLIYADGDYGFENKIEMRSYRNWIAKLISGKSLSYNIYTAKEYLRMAFSPKDQAELFFIEITQNNSIFFQPNLHFARTLGLELRLENKDWKSTLNDGFKLKTVGEGKLFLKGYGKIIEQKINSAKPVLVDEEALIAFDEKLQVKTVSNGIKDFVTSGEGFLYAISGEGTIWLQTRNKEEKASSGGFIDSIFSFLT